MVAHTEYSKGSSGDVVYCLGLVGAMIFYIQRANGFGEVVVAILKAFVWPAFTVYDLLRFLAGQG